LSREWAIEQEEENALTTIVLPEKRIFATSFNCDIWCSPETKKAPPADKAGRASKGTVLILVRLDLYTGGWKEGWKKKKPPTRISRKWLYLLVAGKGFEPMTFGL